MLRVIVVVAVFALVTLPLMPVQWLAIALKRPLRRRIPVFYHRFVCRLLGIRVRCVGAPVDQRPLLIVANHSSWLDISVITACAPVVFVAKARNRALAVLRPARQAAALGLRRARPPAEDRRGQCRDRPASRRGRPGPVVR